MPRPKGETSSRSRWLRVQQRRVTAPSRASLYRPRRMSALQAFLHHSSRNYTRGGNSGRWMRQDADVGSTFDFDHPRGYDPRRPSTWNLNVHTRQTPVLHYDSDETLPWHEDFEHDGALYQSTVQSSFRRAVEARDTHPTASAAGGGYAYDRDMNVIDAPTISHIQNDGSLGPYPEYRALNAMRRNRASGPGPTGSGGPLSESTRAGMARRPGESLQSWLERNGLPSSFP